MHVRVGQYDLKSISPLIEHCYPMLEMNRYLISVFPHIVQCQGLYCDYGQLLKPEKSSVVKVHILTIKMCRIILVRDFECRF